MSNDAKKYLDSEGLSYFWDKIKDYVGEAVESGTSDIANKIHFVAPNEKGAIQALTATVSDVDALSPGLVVALRMPFDSVASQTLNINNLGAKPIYYKNNTTDAGVFPSGAVVLLVYETASVGTGCFKAVYSYDGAQPNVYQGATENANGVAGLVPSALSEEKDRFLKGDGTWASTNIGLSLEHVPAGTKTVSVPYSPEAAEMGVSNDDESFRLGTSISIDNETVYNENKTHPVGNIPLDCSSLNINDDSVINISLRETSGGGDFWLRYTLEANFNELVSAGTEGMPLTEDTSNSADYSPLPENKEFRVSLTDEGNGQYSLYPFIVENQLIPEKDNLVVEQPDGTTTSVDMGPLLNSVSIGGRIEERVVEVEGTIEYLQFSDGEEEPTAFPVYDASGMMHGGFVYSSENEITDESVSLTVDGNTATFEFEEVLPSFIHPIFRVINEESDSSSRRFFLIGLDEQNQDPQGISLEDALSASNGIELHAYDINVINFQPTLANADPIYLYVEKTSDSPFTLQFKLAKKQQRINPVLHLEKSDNNDIDLSPLTNDLLANTNLSYNIQEPQVHSNDNNYFIRIDYYDENNALISSQNYDRNNDFDSMNNDNIEITIPQNCKYFNITYSEKVEGSNKNFAVYNANNIDVSNIRANYVVSSTDPEIETWI